jgi:glutamate dehydrogenase
MILTDNKDKFYEQLDGEIDRHLEGARAIDLKQFSRRYFDNLPINELRNRSLRDVYGALSGSWNFVQTYNPAQPKVRIFNPEYEKHGWQSPYSVVAVHCKDRSFIVDSLRMELNRRNITIHTIHSNVLTVQRDAKHDLVCLANNNLKRSKESGTSTEALVYIEISRHSDPRVTGEIRQTLIDILDEVRVVVDDFQAMRNQAQYCLDNADSWFAPLQQTQRDEAKAFLSWFVDNHFTFLGFEQLSIEPGPGTSEVTPLQENALGLLRTRDTKSRDEVLSLVKTASNREALWDECISFDKSSVRSRVHRGAYPLYARILQFNDEGLLVGEYRFLGLFTSAAYTNPTKAIPIIRKKLEKVVLDSGFDRCDHGGKELRRTLEVYPREELFLSSVAELSETAMAINAIQERRQVRLFMRTERSGKFVSCLVYAPKDIYRTELRAAIQKILYDALNAQATEFTTYFSESVLTRTHFVFRVDETQPHNYDIQTLQDEIVQASKSWSDLLVEALRDEFGEEQGNAEAFRYANAFPPGYQHDFDPLLAVNDIKKCNALSQRNGLSLSFYRVMADGANLLRLRLYHQSEPLPLSDVIPVLENMGLRVLSENPYQLKLAGADEVWLHDFQLIYSLADTVDIALVKEKVQDAFIRIWHQDAESDSFNKLLLGTQLDWRQVALLRAYSRYMKQIQVSYSGEYIAGSMTRYLDITQLLVDLFVTRFDPDAYKSDKKRHEHEAKLEASIIEALDGVDNLNDDQIFRSYLELIKATLRTNYYQLDGNEQQKGYFSFKIAPSMVSDMPLPKPMFEIFVYAPWVEGVHLRGGKVARGGLRWSDRIEDFRTEVLGLVKAQQVKNAVIVPVGAKGGFVAKHLASFSGREAQQEEGIRCYKTFIRGLLDITDNLVEGEVAQPHRVLRHDEDDTYLVVAADKGTATFSDIANSISEEYGFWLGDAFASGGSIGYDHKKMGITAKGAWVSVQRHFREKGINVQDTDFTVIGIGDMSGDVFGNGMLLSEHICLTAAFNHLHIFIDPNPDAAASFAERKRLFELPRSGWNDYDASLISKGGGLFSRAAKHIDLTPEMKARFGINADRLTPNQLISALLLAPVDLIWNGGIGTYIKASTETHAEVGDKANDILRVNANKLRCKVIGEGGNLGVTQLARVEFALHGGASNTDFIDNAAGVDCSDHEVNIKILLNEIVAQGDLTEKQRRVFLEEMTDSVSELVLANNYRQTQAISIAESEIFSRMGEFRRLIHGLETRGKLDRALEYIPDDDVLAERKVQNKGLMRPEISVLISYVKGELKETLVKTKVPEDPYIIQAVETAFPPVLSERYHDAVYSHRLYREIVATQVANDMVNLMGITFIERLMQSLGCDVGAVTRAFVTARDVFRLPAIWKSIEDLDHQVSAQLQMEMMADMMRLVRRATRWFIRNRRSLIKPAEKIALFQPAVDTINAQLCNLLHGDARKVWQRKMKRLMAAGVPETLANTVAGSASLYASLGIAEAARSSNATEKEVAEVYFALGETLELDWMNQQVADIKIDNHWQALARESFRDDIEWQQSSLTSSVLNFVRHEQDLKRGIESWIGCQTEMVSRWRSMITELQQTDVQEFAMFSVATRELLDLAQNSMHSSVQEGADAKDAAEAETDLKAEGGETGEASRAKSKAKSQTTKPKAKTPIKAKTPAKASTKTSTDS